MVFHSASCVYKCNWRQMRYLFNTAVSSLIRLIILVLIIFCSYCKPICRLFLGSVQCYFIRQVVIIKLRMRFKAISSRVWCLYTCLQIHALFFSVHTVLNSKKRWTYCITYCTVCGGENNLKGRIYMVTFKNKILCRFHSRAIGVQTVSVCLMLCEYSWEC